MATDHIRYDILVQDALRGMVRDVLADVAKKGLPGDHHFFITFDTNADGVRLSERLHERYPEEMTVVLQHQFWDLKLTDTGFEVGLSFGGVPERLYVPFFAISGFADPSVQFALQFETLTEENAEDIAAEGEADAGSTPRKPGKGQSASRTGTGRPGTSVPVSPQPALKDTQPVSSKEQTSTDGSSENSGAEVVRLDRFRKK